MRQKKTSFHPVVIAWFAVLLAIVAGILIYNVTLFVKNWGLGSWIDRAVQSILFIGMVYYADGIIDIFMKQRKGIWKMIFSTPVTFVALLVFFAVLDDPLWGGGDGWKTFVQFYVAIPTAFALLSVVVLQIRRDGSSAWNELE